MLATGQQPDPAAAAQPPGGPPMPFDPEETSPGPFTTAAGRPVTAPRFPPTAP